MDTVRDLSSALWSLRTSQEAARLLRTSLSLLRCFLFFDICYLIGGITLISMALSNQVKDQDNRMVFAGGLLTLFGSLSAMCNSLASHGLRTWRRAFLLPWLLFFLLVLAFLFLHLAQVPYHTHLKVNVRALWIVLDVCRSGASELSDRTQAGEEDDDTSFQGLHHFATNSVTCCWHVP